MDKLKKTGILIIALMLLGGCASGNIRIPEEHMAPKEAKKGDSYIFLDSLRHDGNITKVSERHDGKTTLRILFSTKGDDVEELNLYYRDGTLKKQNMESAGVYRGVEYYVGEIEVEAVNLEYFFEARDGRVRYFVGETGEYSPKKIEKFTYEVEEGKLLEVPQWSKNSLWYGIYVDTFNNANEDNDPIFNEMGPEYFFQPRAKMESGQYKSELIDRGLWRSVDTLGEFQVSDWTGDFSVEEAYEKNMTSKYNQGSGKNTRRYGGDLQGVQEKLYYLKNMGVDVVNLSSVFYSYSAHKMDVIDYRHVSPDLAQVKSRGKSEYMLLDVDHRRDENKLGEGLESSTWKMTESDMLLEELILSAHNKEMKVVLDVNLDYVSKRFWALKQLMLQGKESPYRDWFYLEDNWDKRIEYRGTSVVGIETGDDGKKYRKAWIEAPEGASVEVIEEVYRWNLEHMGVKFLDEGQNMVAVNYSNEGYRTYIKDSLKKWVELGVDGYRIEASNVPRDLIREIEESLSKEKKDLLLVRAWERSTHLDDTNFHSKDNYALGSIIIDYLDSRKKLSKDELENAFYIYSKLNTLDNVYAGPLYLDSKDTDRVFSMMANPGRKYDSLNTPESNYLNIRPDLADRRAVARVKVASLIQLTMAGSPYIYYGSEAGMWGGDAPYSRKPMLWSGQKNQAERDRYETYEALGKLNLNGVEYNKVRKYVEYPVTRNNEISSHYTKVLDFRRENAEIFREGKVRFLEAVEEESGKTLDDVLAYERILGEKRVIVVVNRGTTSRKVGIYTDGRGEFDSLFKEENKKITGKRLKVDIGPLEGAIYYN
ncbi:alpha-amylase [Propionigenium maris DSM 9537]|uniref:Alpha-amylase n=1 Tax=Propionigenium maris DSM 9537 TaxID=1123000 RepID=A0A9W6GKQ9_9FUSO|nr:alpha-amylase [Propionigenium maris DSM 9537]